MVRRPNTRPTLIYWLVDTRTGIPFYCGKTVLPLYRRLVCHKYEAANGERRVHVKVRECGEHISICKMESVPPDGDWVAREKRWIYLLRGTHSDCCNTADGGAGCPGRIASAETRAKLSAWQQGRKLTDEHKEKIRQFVTGTKRSPEVCASMSAKMKGRKQAPEHIAKSVAARKGKKRQPHTDEHKEKISAGNKGKKRTPEQIERVIKGQKAAHYTRHRARGVCASSFLFLPC